LRRRRAGPIIRSRAQEIEITTSKAFAATLSTRGRITLPKAIRDRLGWGPGAELVVEDTPAGILLRRAPLFAPTRLEDVVGCLAYAGPRLSVGQMDEAISAEVRRRATRD
jgi:AbrB family looped-hinge helix DNA binding protein